MFVYFDDLMYVDATLAALSSSVPLPCGWGHFFSHSASARTLDSAFYCRSTTDALEPAITYVISVGTGAKDTSGNALAAPFSFSFATTAAE